MKSTIKIIFTAYLLLTTYYFSTAQIAINEDGNTPDASAMLDVSSTNKGILIPRMDSTSRKDISNPAIGLMVYDSTTHSFWFYNTAWEEIKATSTEGDNLGNHTATENIKTNGHYISNDGDNEGIYVNANGNVGIGTIPTSLFHVNHSNTVLDVEAINDVEFDIGSGAQWQSFTATNSGTISSIELKFMNGASGQRTLTLYEGVGTSGNVLATATGTPSGNGWLSFAISASQVENSQYTIALDEADDWAYYDDVAYDDESSDGAYSRFEHRVYISLTRELIFSEEDLTIGEYALPLDDGTDGQLLVTDGTGQVTWSNLSDYIQTDGQYLSNDGDDEGLFIDTVGNIGVGVEPENLFDILINDVTIDVENDNSSAYVTSNIAAWQAYTAVNSAQVQEVQFMFAGSISGSQYRDITIYEGEGTGGTVLATGVMGEGGGWQSCYVNYEQVAGQKYTIHLTRRYNIRYSASNTYTGGQSNLNSGDYRFRVYIGVRDTISATLEGLVIGAYTMPLEDGEDGNVLVTDGNGTVSWTTSSSSGSVFSSVNGVTTSSNNSDDLVFGADALDWTSGTEYKFFFDQSKGAFRAGKVSTTNWDESNLGNQSFAFGDNIMVSGTYSGGWGAFNSIAGNYATGFGISNTINGEFATSWGGLNTASGSAATTWGNSNTASGTFSTAFGQNNTAPSYAETVIGSYATTYSADNATAYDADDRVFVIGNGSSTSNRSNAMTVYKNGDTEINGNFTVSDTLGVNGEATFNENVLITKEIGGNNTFIFNVENMINNSGSKNNGIEILAGHNSANYTGSKQSQFIRFSDPDGTTLGSIYQDAAGTVGFTGTSDIRLKENILPSKYGLSDILNIKVRDYNYKSDASKTPQTGFLAQQLYEVFPVAVSVGGDDEKTNPWMVDYSKMTPLLVKGMQDQQAEIEELRMENGELRSEVDTLKKEVSKIKQLEHLSRDLVEQNAEMKAMLEQIQSRLLSGQLE